MGDDRPPAYLEGDTLVLRASAFGSCLWELIATLQGHEPQPWPNRMKRAFAEGNVAEREILDRLEATGWKLDRDFAQSEHEMKVGAGRIIRFHPDGRGASPRDGMIHLIEGKALHNSSWGTIRRHGIKAMSNAYQWQASVMAHHLRLPVALVVLNKGETPDQQTGKRPPCEHQGELHFEFLRYPDDIPFSRADIVRRAKEIADAVGEDVVMAGRPCDDPAQWPCRFIHLRPEPEGQGVAVPQEEVEEFEWTAEAYEKFADIEKRAKASREAARDKLVEMAGNSSRLFTDTWEVPVTGGETTSTDWNKFLADKGIDRSELKPYQTTKPKAKSVKVVRR